MSNQFGAQLVGREWEVKLAYTVEYNMRVKAGVEKQSAIDEADLLRMANSDTTPTDRDLVHTEVKPVRNIFEDEPDAHEAADWLDAPTAPSEDTYWDDSVHFSDRYADTAEDES